MPRAPLGSDEAVTVGMSPGGWIYPLRGCLGILGDELVLEMSLGEPGPTPWALTLVFLVIRGALIREHLLLPYKLWLTSFPVL